MFAAAGVPVPTVLSPRMRWMQAHGVKVVELPEGFYHDVIEVCFSSHIRRKDAWQIDFGKKWAAHQEACCPVARIVELFKRWHEVAKVCDDEYELDRIADDIADEWFDLHFGATEADACAELGRKKKLPHWTLGEGGLA